MPLHVKNEPKQMAEKETQGKTSQEATEESKKTEETQEEQTIPKNRFDEVNEKRKVAEERLKELEEAEAERKKEDLKKNKEFEKLSEQQKAEIEQLKLDGKKRDLISEAISNKELHPKLAKMVTGSTEDEIKKSLEDAKAYHQEIQEQFKDDNTATDDSGSGKKKKKEAMSTEEWMELYDKDPDKADKILAEETEAANK